MAATASAALNRRNGTSTDSAGDLLGKPVAVGVGVFHLGHQEQAPCY